MDFFYTTDLRKACSDEFAGYCLHIVCLQGSAVSYFSRYVKTHLGFSPAEYRKSKKASNKTRGRTGREGSSV